MSAATFYAHVFKPGGDPYFSLTEAVLGLGESDRTAAIEVGAAMMILAREDRNFSPTWAQIAARLPSSRGQEEGSPPGHRSHSFVGKGRRALDKLLGVIERVRHGNVVLINWTRGLKPSRDPGPASPASPPGPPPGEERRDTTTDGGSSSCPGSTPDRIGDLPSAELIARACKLVRKATAGRVIDAAAVYGSEWVSRALDRVEERNRKPGNKPVESWGFVLGVLANWRKEGGPPPEEPAPAPSQPVAPAGRAAEEGPPRPLTAEELAELVSRCQSGPRPLLALSRVQLRRAMANGLVAAELMATIPAELLEPDPRAP